MKVNLMSVQ